MWGNKLENDWKYQECMGYGVYAPGGELGPKQPSGGSSNPPTYPPSYDYGSASSGGYSSSGSSDAGFAWLFLIGIVVVSAIIYFSAEIGKQLAPNETAESSTLVEAPTKKPRKTSSQKKGSNGVKPGSVFKKSHSMTLMSRNQLK